MKKPPKNIKLPKYKVVKIGEHIFETTQVRVYNVGKDGVYGDKYTSMLTINFIDGEAYINSAIGEFTRKCFRTIFNYIKGRGIKAINYKRIKNLKDKHNKVKTK